MLLKNMLISVIVWRAEQGSCDRTTVNHVEGALGWLDFNLFDIVETFNMVGQNMANSLILRFKTNTVGDRDMEGV